MLEYLVQKSNIGQVTVFKLIYKILDWIAGHCTHSTVINHGLQKVTPTALFFGHELSYEYHFGQKLRLQK